MQSCFSNKQDSCTWEGSNLRAPGEIRPLPPTTDRYITGPVKDRRVRNLEKYKGECNVAPSLTRGLKVRPIYTVHCSWNSAKDNKPYIQRIGRTFKPRGNSFREL